MHETIQPRPSGSYNNATVNVTKITFLFSHFGGIYFIVQLIHSDTVAFFFNLGWCIVIFLSLLILCMCYFL